MHLDAFEEAHVRVRSLALSTDDGRHLDALWLETTAVLQGAERAEAVSESRAAASN